MVIRPYGENGGVFGAKSQEKDSFIEKELQEFFSAKNPTRF